MEFVVRHYHEISVDTNGKVMFGNCPGTEQARFEFKLRLIIADGTKPHLQDIEVEAVSVLRWRGDTSDSWYSTKVFEDWVPKAVMEQMKLDVRFDFAAGNINMEGIMYERQIDNF